MRTSKLIAAIQRRIFNYGSTLIRALVLKFDVNGCTMSRIPHENCKKRPYIMKVRQVLSEDNKIKARDY